MSDLRRARGDCTHRQTTPTMNHFEHASYFRRLYLGGSVAECWTQAQKGPGSNRSGDAVG